MAGATIVQQPTNNDLKQLFQDLNKAKELSNEEAVSQAVKRNEDKILEIGKLFQQRGDAESLGQLVKMVRPYLGSLSKAKAAKLVRQLVDLFLDMESAVGLEVDLCKECIEWARQEKRNYLRQGTSQYLTTTHYDSYLYESYPMTHTHQLYTRLID
jgi:26S proteasome regulatory subunit N6